MHAALLARLTLLLLVLALLVPSAPAAAADRAPYVRAVSKGRVALHRPNYKSYKANQNRWFFQRW
ncbi:hypothetical protein SAMN02745146_1575 [Hymenobacter daecheongensis DSM 21074]|uniref:Uncharacterized protein n=1 Tax=Hymenobacter daecheongensis DSM 21074 TaxID=1121955 RepID=A0A1M6E6V2_9BACT|nr:hypothetical protein [Hymenobacter daecheongensis]SHI81008.1 hypothetical protein SAMN02745146_1575 [Hymenobacter daecheongensis DSM 21074]